MLFLLTLLPLVLIGAAIADDDDDNTDVTPSTSPSDGDDVITGTGSADDISALAGDDIITGAAGDDTLDGAQGNDIVVGDGGLDQIRGGDDNDLLLGRGGADTVEGNAGNDWVEGDGGDDFVTGGRGDDTVIGSEGADVLVGGNADDVLIDGVVPGTPLGLDVLEQLRSGTSLLDIVGTDALNYSDDLDQDILNGNDGDDVLIFGKGDLAIGEGGADQFAMVIDGVDSDLDVARITDFNPAFETLALIVPTDATETPAISITAQGDDAVVSVDGIEMVAIIGAAGQIDVDDISIFAGISPTLLDPNPAVA